ncbi:hypothetical protein [Streptomyces melanogenes]|uniref:hypothetical protein n=1 Tax=Streptomyces melanogenes TaxID=67326 RepID=UPI003799AE0D
MVAILAVATACSSSGDEEKSDGDAKISPSTSAPGRSTPSADPAEAAKGQAIATYQSYWREMEKLYADRNGNTAALKRFAASAALKSAEEDAKSTHDKNLIHLGQVSIGNPTVTRLDTSGKIANATLSSCLDISRWQVVDATTRKPATLPSNRLTKFVVATTIEHWPEGWRVIRDEPQDKSC